MKNDFKTAHVPGVVGTVLYMYNVHSAGAVCIERTQWAYTCRPTRVGQGRVLWSARHRAVAGQCWTNALSAQCLL